MSERCHSCGAELFAGQQFCRRCGVPVAAPQGRGDAQTQLFPRAGEGAGAQPPRQTGDTGPQPPHVSTARLGTAQQTDEFGRGLHTAHQPPLASYQQTSQLAPPRPPRKRRWLLWSLLGLGAFVVCATALVAAFLVRSSERPRKVVVVKGAGASGRAGEVPPPPAPPGLPERIKQAVAGVGVPLPIDEGGARVSGDETVFAQSFELDEDAGVSFKGRAGDVTVVGTDGPRVEVKIAKRGGSHAERSAQPVLFSKTDGGLSFFTMAPPGGRVKVACEIRVPRGLKRLEVAAEAGRVKVEDFGGEVDVELHDGEIDIAASGAVRSRLTNGRTKVTYDGPRDEPQEFAVTNGTVEVSFGGEPEASLKAETANGDIKLDGDFGGLESEKRAGGRRLEADLGGGGARLAVSVKNGDIKLRW